MGFSRLTTYFLDKLDQTRFRNSHFNRSTLIWCILDFSQKLLEGHPEVDWVQESEEEELSRALYAIGVNAKEMVISGTELLKMEIKDGLIGDEHETNEYLKERISAALHDAELENMKVVPLDYVMKFVVGEDNLSYIVKKSEWAKEEMKKHLDEVWSYINKFTSMVADLLKTIDEKKLKGEDVRKEEEALDKARTLKGFAETAFHRYVRMFSDILEKKSSENDDKELKQINEKLRSLLEDLAKMQEDDYYNIVDDEDLDEDIDDEDIDDEDIDDEDSEEAIAEQKKKLVSMLEDIRMSSQNHERRIIAITRLKEEKESRGEDVSFEEHLLHVHDHYISLCRKEERDILEKLHELDERAGVKPIFDDQAIGEEAMKIVPGLNKRRESEKGSKLNDGKADSEKQRGDLVKIAHKMKDVQKRLLGTIYGQDFAVNTFISGYFQAEISSLINLNAKHPRAMFLFCGSPGVGKTYLSETAADILGLPFRRFDMSEYADHEAHLRLCGFAETYKNSVKGELTSFVQNNPKCVILFDEIEKAHIDVIHLFLQVLDAGRLKDNFRSEDVDFKDTILIFTTNAGKQLYETSERPMSSVSTKSVIRALQKDVNPATSTPYFPMAMCSRFAAGNIVMFNNLTATDLLRVINGEFNRQIEHFGESAGMRIEMDKHIAYALLFGEGGAADARTARGKATKFVYKELFELFRLATSEHNDVTPEKISNVRFDIDIPSSGDIAALFKDNHTPEILVFAEKKVYNKVRKQFKQIKCHFADSVEAAKNILYTKNIRLILCDIRCKVRSAHKNVLDIEDTESNGKDMLNYVNEHSNTPIYILETEEDGISFEEVQSLIIAGAKGILPFDLEDEENYVLGLCESIYQQNKLAELARANKVLSFRTAQIIEGETAVIRLFDLKLVTAVDAEDEQSIVSISYRPDVRFSDVIGAEDAKKELQFYADYLKAPAEYMRKGLRPPKGILLYGSPGTGKTLLAKAMAGESDVTFLTSQGNDFLQRYVGTSADAVHEMFRKARKYAPAVLFVDEIDAIARPRGTQSGELSSEALTAFLTEMDGFKTETDKPIFVLAATNADVENGGIDAALLRRFDRTLLVDLPNKDEREQFIRMKAAKNSQLANISDEEIKNLAMRSTGMSLADLDSVIEMSLRNAARSEDGYVTDASIDAAFETFNGGEENQWSEEELQRTARHEAGHALVSCLLGKTPSYLTIVSRGSYGGYMQHSEEHKGSYMKSDLIDTICISLAGRAAEMVCYGDEQGLTTGASSDIASATRIAEHMICSYGMDETFGMATIDLNSDHYARVEVNKRINAILAEQLQRAKDIMKEHIAAHEALTSELLRLNHMRGEDVKRIIDENSKNKI